MRALRNAPLSARREVYVRDRLCDQIGYYRERGAWHAGLAAKFRAATLLIQLAGFAGAILKAVDILNVDLLGFAAAIAAGLIAWLQTRDHVTLARAYRLTAEDLERAQEDLPPIGEEAEWAAYVADAESAMSREHVMWLARRGREGARSS